MSGLVEAHPVSSSAWKDSMLQLSASALSGRLTSCTQDIGLLTATESIS